MQEHEVLDGGHYALLLAHGDTWGHMGTHGDTMPCCLHMLPIDGCFPLVGWDSRWDVQGMAWRAHLRECTSVSVRR